MKDAGDLAVILCQACLLRRCPVHLGIFKPPEPRIVHYAGCQDESCTGCLPPQWLEWEQHRRTRS